MGRDKATVCRVVKHVTEGLVEMKDRFIRWPTRMDTRRNIMAGFADVAGIPNVIGAIDGSHVEITKPGPTEERPFINRKGRASINVMAVCDNKGRFTFINAEWPGSAHDSFVFRASSLQDFLEENIHTLEDGVLLADSGYACSRYMLTPYRVSDTPVKTRFNRAHCRSRVVIERTFGRWKRRFSVMCKKVRKTPAQACREIVACAALHNIAMLFGEPDVDDGDVDELPLIPYVGGENGFAIRDHIAQAYFG
ncbi:putative nuclease HARBI1 [Mya arenaria]|uniref:putative nuclease HARBI1 n=1 Tax=Mya arenaria TaxID=6604 RepID=UPI0022DEE7AF|nr:putative nuclease HARBI1 [Mya arenaria]